MNPKLVAAAAVVLGLASPQAAQAEADLLTAKKFSCAPDRVTRCSAENKCETKDATERDKTQLLLIDAEAKQASMRREGQERPAAAARAGVVEDKTEGDVRKIVLRESGEGSRQRVMTLTLTRAGKLTMSSDEGRQRAEATCTPVS